MFSPINTRKDQMQAREKHSDPVLLLGVKLSIKSCPVQVLSNAVPFLQCFSQVFKNCHMWKHHVLSPSHDDTGYNVLARPEHLSDFSQMLAKKYTCLPKCQDIHRET